MITEQYIEFETAKLLKEKGFNEDCMFVVNLDSNGILPCSFGTKNSEIDNKNIVTIPPQSLVMRWLREVYGLFIEIHTFYESEELPFACRYQIISNNKDYESMEDESDECFYTYEEAVEAAITECLECYL